MVPGKVFELTGTQVLDDAVTAVNLVKMTSRADLQTMFLAGASTQPDDRAHCCVHVCICVRTFVCVYACAVWGFRVG